jgi:hypothetical protein
MPSATDTAPAPATSAIVPLLRALVGHRDPFIREIAARHPATPPDAMEALAERDTPTSVRGLVALAANPSCPPALRERLANHRIPAVRQAASEPPGSRAPLAGPAERSPKILGRDFPEVMAQIAKDPDPAAQALVQAGPRARAILAEQLAEDSDPALRAAAAACPETSPERLRALARDPMFVVRMAAVTNPACPPDLLEQLAGAAVHPWMAEHLAAHRGLSLEARLRLALDRAPGALAGIVQEDAAAERHIITSEQLRHWILGSSDMTLQAEALAHPSCPRDLLERFSNDIDRVYRWGVARNPCCPPEILARLAQDDDEGSVREAAWDTWEQQARGQWRG